MPVSSPENMALPEPLRLLMVEDSEDDALLLQLCLEEGGHKVEAERVADEAAMAACLSQPWDAIISDVSLPGFGAEGSLALYRASGLDCPFIVVSGAIGEEAAVALLKAGAHDFVRKDNLARLVPALRRELREATLRRQKREAEEALRISRERYALAAAGANDGLWDWDLRREEIYFSPRWRAMIGMEEAEPDAPSMEDWLGRVHPEDRAGVEVALREHLQGASPQFWSEHRILHSSGEWRWVMARGVAVTGDDGRPSRVAGSFTDVSHLKMVQEQLQRAKEELERAIAAKSRFLAAASHDLRQPVQALFLFIETLAGITAQPQASVLVARIREAAMSLKELLDKILDVSKIDAGIIEKRTIRIPLATFIPEVVEQMRPLAEQKGLKLNARVPELHVESDPVLLACILRNLLCNAIRYTDSGGILVGARRRGQEVRMEVWDTGCGIPEDAIEVIFEEFFQLENVERDRHKGLGLGLAIAAKLGQLLDHRIDVCSRVGKGSMFAVWAERIGD